MKQMIIHGGKPLQGDVWILRRRAAAYGEGEGEKSEFHGLEVFIH